MSDTSRQKLSNLAKELSKIYPCEIEIHICDDSVFEGMPKFRGNNLAFYRVLIPNFMPKNIKLCLYLDIDMLVHNDLRGLFSLDLENKYAGVVWLHDYTIGIFAKNSQDKNFYFKDFYFNSGFLLFNLNQWLQNDLATKILDFTNKYRVLGPDPDALNGIIHKENALILPYEYNILIAIYCHNGTMWRRSRIIYHIPYAKEQIDFAYSNPTIWHFVEAIDKPWNGCISGIDENGKALEMYW